ncbi:endo-1,4-beta-xylanase [Cellulomonas fengjieae]|uniref:Beta-xylanase n=1 Tax=Cellulomonas fengjieae TaxID=2819978 RepID=A0ABS3SDJ0_9CELL|nr:endo-1,4-beta-xylanase [Cellulomonas fengjieae]MBO3083797.1 endo-1,4-beta-xylanase [Cellulomonas fengjieae]MBO3101454.1 endo-1,4-beta-xylanase [Cellulomonas fengjieae]QVI64913.1 endo-1,4-beta-xylanase [Cellulomonas fengjieae]
MPVTHPRRSTTLRTAAVALAATIAVGAAVTIPAQAASTLKDLATAAGKDIGFALAPDRLSESAYKSIADSEFNLVVAENAMKWDATEPSQNSFSYGAGDQVASYAASTGKELYGHTLVWHSQLPNWVKNLSGTALQSAMTNHVTNVATHYKGKVSSWDVVNEAFDDDGTRRDDSTFQQKLGDGYIETAFRAARAADPTAKLCINDYNTDAINAKSTAIYNLVRDFKARGVPIDCVGFQSHLIIGQVPSTMQQNLQRFADLGVDVRITELDIRMQTPADANKLATQAADYKKVFQICNAVSRCQGVTIWGITDKYSWVPDTFPGQGAALVWDSNYAKKPAYDAIASAFAGITPTTPPVTPPVTDPPVTEPPVTEPPVTQPPTAGCQVTYGVNQWNTGFTANVTVKNTSTAPINGWTLTFSFPSGQTVTQAWSSVTTQSGSAVTVRNAPWNGSIPAGGSQQFGFNGAHSGTNAAPTAFALNGTACSAG